jgi:DNA-binding IclR family transcriptional regulator
MDTPLDPAAAPKLRAKRALEKHAAAGAAEHAFPTIKALAIIETLASARRPLGVSDISALQNMPKPTAHRIVRMLESEGLLQREPGKRRFVPGARLMQLGLGIISASMLHAPRHAILESLSNRIGETCNFGVMVGSNAVYLDRVESAWPLGLRFESGSRVPLHCTAMGKLFLSLLPSRKRALLLRTLPLHPLHREHHHRPGAARARTRQRPQLADFDR